jgi:hypothetical protein
MIGNLGDWFDMTSPAVIAAQWGLQANVRGMAPESHPV